MQVVGLDLGRRNIKLVSAGKYISFPAVIGEWRDIKLSNGKSVDKIEGFYKGEKFFAGVLAENESEFYRQMLVEDKATQDALILALIALHKAGITEADIVTGLPVNIHDDTNKKSLINLLTGEHEILVNGVKSEINVKRTRVAVEGGGAFWSAPKDGLIRIIDGGSKTINYVTMMNRKYVDRDSGTLPFGFDTNKSNNIKQMANRIAGELGKKWGKNDSVYTVGGQAKELESLLKPYFPLIESYQGGKKVFSDEGEVNLDLFANAIGYYNIGSVVNG